MIDLLLAYFVMALFALYVLVFAIDLERDGEEVKIQKSTYALASALWPVVFLGVAVGLLRDSIYFSFRRQR